MIPKILHQLWLGHKPIPERWMSTWREQNPDFEYRLWREADVDALGLKNRKLYDEMYKQGLFSGCSDIVRVEILEQHGGVYVDADAECLRPINDLLKDDFFVVQEDQPAWPALLLNGCFMGATPGHPIIVHYRGLIAEAKLPPARPNRRPQATWVIVGPVLLTRAVLDFPGVATVLHPWSFFHVTSKGAPVPVLGKPQPYARHYFANANGWADENSPVPFSILVPHREHPPGPRTRLWDFIHGELKIAFPQAEICVAEDDGIDPFNKCQAMNRAADMATTDIFVLWDSDTWIAPTEILGAVQVVYEDPRQWVKPWHIKVKVNQVVSERVLASGSFANHRPNDLVKQPENRNSYWAAPPIVLARAAYEAVNGMDERIAGWGSEDACFAWALRTLWNKGITTGQKQPAIHLWHPRIGQSGSDAWIGQELGHSNRAEYALYKELEGNVQGMTERVAGNRGAS